LNKKFLVLTHNSTQQRALRGLHPGAGLGKPNTAVPALHILGLADCKFPVNQSAVAVIAGLTATQIKEN
jgi:hypothetical protein